MAEYLKRHAELNTRLDEIDAQLLETERFELRAGVTDYTDARNQTLNTLLILLNDTDSSPSADTEWRHQVKLARNALDRTIGDVLAGVPEPSLTALIFRALTLQDEHRFWESLRDVSAAGIRDFMTSERKQLELLVSELEKKWSEIKTFNDDVAGAEKTVSDEVRTLFDQAVTDVAAQRATVNELVALVPVMINEWPNMLPKQVPLEVKSTLMMLKRYLEKQGGADMLALTHATGQVGAAMKKMRPMLLDFQLRIADYERLVRQEKGGAHVFFKQSYTDTKNFVDNHGYDAGKAAFDKAKADLATWSSSCTGKQRDDAEAFATDLLQGLARNLAKTETVFTAFVTAHKGKFFGALDLRTVEELTRYQLWEDRLGELRVIDLETKLRAFRSDAQSHFQIDLDGPFAATRETIKQLPNLTPSERQELLDLRAQQETKLKELLYNAVDEVVRQAEETEREVAIAKLIAIFRRDSLKQNLPS